MHNKHHSIQVPCKFQINRFINNREVDDPNTRTVYDQGTRAVDIPSIRAVYDLITRAVDDPSKGRRKAAIAALHASLNKSCYNQENNNLIIINHLEIDLFCYIKIPAIVAGIQLVYI